MTKIEPTSDDFHFMPAPNGTEVFGSPVESPLTASSSSSAAFPVLGCDTTHAESSTSSNWATDFKAGEMMDNFDLLNPYDVEHPAPVHPFADNSGIDFNIYDDFTFHHIAEDSSTTLTDQYI